MTLSRFKKIFHTLDPNGFGLEIGPSYNPVAPKKQGFKVEIIDHLNRNGLIKKYEDDRRHKNRDRQSNEQYEELISNIEEVDFIWRGESYEELTGKQNHYDWIIASHVIEHTTDLIAFINDCDSILKSDGVLSLVIPDKRYCFDKFRTLTGISEVIDTHLQNKKTHSPGVVADYYLNVVSRENRLAWGKYWFGEFAFLHPPATSFKEYKKAIDSTEYDDYHRWVVTPNSFRLLVEDLNTLGLIQLKEASYFRGDPDGCEFHILLSRTGQGLNIDRLKMLQKIDLEIASEVGPLRLRRVFGLTRSLTKRTKRKLKRFIRKVLG